MFILKKKLLEVEVGKKKIQKNQCFTSQGYTKKILNKLKLNFKIMINKCFFYTK